MKIIGRKEEIEVMSSFLTNKRAHLLAVIGRRRVGKTFLIREVYKKKIAFEMTGLKNADLNNQLLNFTLQINTYFPREEQYSKPDSWLLAFNLLSKTLSYLNTDQKPVVFFDEIPWIASKRSGFMEALAHWWNNWASQQNIIVVICGSAASWMLEHVVNAKGGLHNRITKLITLMPFTLSETKEFLEEKRIEISNYQIIQLYLAMGGIPHYLEHISKGKSAAHNIQEMCFSKDGILNTEFENLYPALFDNAGNHIKIIKALASKSRGLERQEILKITGMSDGGWFSNILNELGTSGFISTYEPLEKKKKDTLYRLTDEYSLFYLNFIEDKSKSGLDNWMRMSQSQEYKIWCGYAFENLCMKHVDDIKKALGISGVQTNVNSFLHRKDETYEKGFQIDMLIDRKDDVINICEMKFYSDEFSISSEYAKNLRTKKQGLKVVTKTKKMVYITFITTYGVLENQNKIDLVENDFTIDILFNS
ncbi:AAA family ATPase [Flavivirga rizhaonensis]|uniref:AAA family ATPase n=1 Tax=Flavivirga rizhaonensis TaxID=2559571 RepID=A0A4S1E2F7_9FLAO|nr:ATP-binding protein [Flavivirga rizhaonensis]TGV04709.1 AAA family ATPase [Flavivirga rizhaonensis]